MQVDAGFFVPDDVVRDVQAITLPGMHLYLILGRCRSLAEYPPLEEIAREMRKKQADVWKLVGLLYERKYLNDADVERLMEASNPEGSEGEG